MILRRLIVRRFASLNPGARIDRFGERITLIHGPNEAGKSTLLRALEYALFQRHRGGGDEVEQQIVPRGTSVAPEVVVELEVAGARLRVRKRFVKGPSAEVEEFREGRFEVIADGKGVEFELEGRLGIAHSEARAGKPELRGISEILIVAQGGLRFGKELGDRARQQLLPLMGGVVTTSRAHALLEGVRERFGKVLKDSGAPRKGTQLDEAQRERDGIAAALTQLEQRVRDARALERELADDPVRARQQEARRAELLERRTRARAVDARARELTARLEGAKQLEAAAVEARDRAQRDVDDRVRRRTDFEAARPELEAAQRELDRRRELLSLAEKAAAAARDACEHLEARRLELDAGDRRVADALELRRALADEQAQARALARDEELEREIASLERRLGERPRPRRDDLKQWRKLHTDLDDRNRRLAALELRLTLRAQRLLEIEGPAGSQSIAAGGEATFRGADPLAFSIAGVGSFEVRGPEVPQRAKLADERDRLARQLAEATRPYGVVDLDALEQLVEERSAAEREIDVRNAARAQLFADDAARREARATLAAARSRGALLLAANPEWAHALPDDAALARDGTALADRRRALEREISEARASQQRTSTQLERDREDAQEAERKRADAKSRLDAARRELDGLLHEGSDEAACVAALRDAEAALGARRDERAGLELELGRLGDVAEERSAADRAVDQFEEELARERERRATRAGELKNLLRDGLWEQVGDLEARREANAEALARAELDAEALRLLNQKLQVAQAAQLDALVGPLRQRVSRMFTRLAGEPVEIAFGERLLPDALGRESRPAIETELLSAGTQDQVALLTRIALGELWSERHGRHALVLDDPLVNCDPQRRARLLAILERAADRLQLVIFTCDPSAWLGLPDDTVRVALEDARRDFEAANG